MPAVVKSVTERPRTNPGRADNDGETRFYLVEFTEPGFALYEARNASGVPIDGEALTPGSNLLVTYKGATDHPDSPLVAVVEVRWTVPTQSGTPVVGGNWDYAVSSEGVAFTESVTKDVSGKPIKNSAGQPFDPSLNKEYYDERFTIAYTTDTVNPITFANVRGKLNAGALTMNVDGISRTFAAKSVKCENAGWERLVQNGQKYFRVQISLLYRADTWVRKVPDMGFYELTGGNLVPIKDKEGQMVVQPAYLNGSGAKLTAGADAVLLSFNIDDTADFSFLASI